jgi:hypothetical protein
MPTMRASLTISVPLLAQQQIGLMALRSYAMLY